MGKKLNFPRKKADTKIKKTAYD